MYFYIACSRAEFNVPPPPPLNNFLSQFNWQFYNELNLPYGINHLQIAIIQTRDNGTNLKKCIFVRKRPPFLIAMFCQLTRGIEFNSAARVIFFFKKPGLLIGHLFLRSFVSSSFPFPSVFVVFSWLALLL